MKINNDNIPVTDSITNIKYCTTTVPLKGKLTVTRELRNSTRDSILDPRKFRESSL